MHRTFTRLWWLGVVLLLAGCGSTPTASRVLPRLSARSFRGLPQVGALFAGPSDDALHFCTASVVDSPGHDLLVTAAHCVSGTGTDLLFVPGYHDGVAPFGSWRVSAAYVSPRWQTDRAPQADVAFLRVRPQQWAGRVRNVEDVVGADTLVTSPVFDMPVTVVGYPLATGGEPMTCTNGVFDERGYPTFDCGGYIDGTSGAPWIADVDPGTRQGDLYGVIGGLHQGGCTPQISYSSYFGSDTRALYERAIGGGPGDVVPSPGSDGC